MKKNNFKAFQYNKKRKSHNQKIHDANVLRKQVVKEVLDDLSKLLVISLTLFLQTKEKHQQAVNAAMDRYRTNKQTRLKKLVKKTRRGQPVMQGQIELLLDKIQKQKDKQ